MKVQHVFLDFDHTLFNTGAFAKWMDNFFVKHYGIEPEVFTGSLNEHHNYLTDGQRLYQHARHIQQATGRTWSYVSGKIERECRRKKLDFCFPEVHDVLLELDKLYTDIRILTFGEGAVP